MRPLNALIPFFILCIFSLSASAVSLKDIKFKGNEKIGIFIGSFDPVHNGHIKLVENAIKKSNLDYVFVLPNNITFHKKLKVSLAERTKMLHLAFDKNSKVILPEVGNVSSISAPIGMWGINRVLEKCSTCELHGIQGSDVALNNYKRFLDRLILHKLDGWILLARNEADLIPLKSKFQSKNFQVYSYIGNITSTQVRNFLAMEGSFYQTEKNKAIRSNDLIPENVKNYILRNKLYKSSNGGAYFQKHLTLNSLDNANFQWKSGQIIGISSRSGGSPFFVQVSTNSPLDHVAWVSVEEDAIYIYDFTNKNGIAKRPIEELLEGAKGKHGRVMGIVSEPAGGISNEQVSKMKNYTDDIIEKQFQLGIGNVSGAPKNCSNYVNQAFKTAGIQIGRSSKIEEFNLAAFDNLIEDYWKFIIKNTDELIHPVSFFEKNTEVVFSNLSNGLKWDEQQALSVWKADGDFSKIARIVALQNGQTLTSEKHIGEAISNLIKYLDDSKCNSLFKVKPL